METFVAEEIASGLLFGEGIRWTGHDVVLSDMLGKRVVRVDVATGDVSTLVEIENQPNGLVVQDDGSLIINSMFDCKLLRLAGGELECHADLSPLATGYLGDIVGDRHGGFYVDDVGARVLHGEKPRPGRLIYVAPDGTLSVAVDETAFANGVVISPDGARLYLAETMTSTITVYDIGAGGTLANGRVLATFEGESRIDGVCMDEDEGCWACLLDTDRVVRVAPDGSRTHDVRIPGGEPIACTIGGPTGRELFVSAIDALDGRNIFEEMMAKRVRARVWRAAIPFGKGGARP